MAATTRGYVILLIAFLLLVIHQAALSPYPRGGAESRPLGQRIKVNSADAPTLQLLPGIGPSIAENIHQQRLRIGAFHGPSDLQRVRFIGPKLIERIDPWVVYGPVTGETDPGGRGQLLK